MELVERLRNAANWSDDGALLDEAADALVVRSSPSQVAPQPQAGEAVGYVTPDSIAEVAAGRIGNHLFPKGTLRPENEIPVYASPQPANPAQVTDAMVEAVCIEFLRRSPFNVDWSIQTEGYKNVRRNHMRAALEAAIGAGGQAVALREAAEEFCRRVENGEIRSKKSYVAFKSALSQPHPADERVVEALRFYASPGTWEDDRAPDPAGTPIPGTMPADIDRGDIARAALAAKEGRNHG